MVAIGAALYFFGRENSVELDERRVKIINWEKNYESTSKHPYGTYLLRELINDGLPNHSVKDIDSSVQYYFNNDSVQIKSKNPITYMFIGKSLNLYNTEVDSLLAFAEQGNNLFIAAENIPFKLLNELMNTYGNGSSFFNTKNDTSMLLNFSNESFPEEYEVINIQNHIAQTCQWRTFNYGLSYNVPTQKLGKANYNYCFKKFKIGNGSILIHTIPLAFTNQFLKTEEGKEYVEIVLSYFNASTILWDNYTKYIYTNPDMELDNGNDRSGSSYKKPDKLKYILQTPGLMQGYFVLILAVVLFVIFVGKREQKIIPTTQINTNSSMEFTETLARLYLKQGQHNKLIKHMEHIFKDKMKNKYYLSYSDDKSYIDRLSKKSGVDQKLIEQIFHLFNGGKTIANVSDEYLINLYQKLNEFYKKAN